MKYLELCKNFNEENPSYEFFGIRADNKKYGIGEVVSNSFVWEDGNPTDEKLNGSCAIWLWDYWTEKYNSKAHDRIKDMYDYDSYVYIVASKGCEEGEDKGEWILPEAIVISIIES